MNLRDPDAPVGVGHAAADRIGDPLCYLHHLGAAVEAEAEASHVTAGILDIAVGPRSGS